MILDIVSKRFWCFNLKVQIIAVETGFAVLNTNSSLFPHLFNFFCHVYSSLHVVVDWNPVMEG